MSESRPTLYVVIPCFNEQEVLKITACAVSKKLDEMLKNRLISKDSRLLFIDDGSLDGTWQIIEELNKTDPFVCGIKLSINRGHQNALLAGLYTAKDYADCVITMDADLQDDVDLLPRFIAKYNEGNHIVYGVRSDRKKDSAFKRSTAQCYYKFLKLLGVNIIYNHADFRLMSRTAIEALATYNETNIFLRGIVPMLGYKSDKVYYERKERAAGKTKYPLKKMIKFAIEGITSFSIKPIKIIGNIGIIISVLSIFALIYALVSKITGNAVTGWTAIVASIWLIGGIQLFCLGVIGTYIGKIYGEVKNRPKYTIETFLKK